MDNTTYSKIKYEKRKEDTVVIVSGNKTWYAHLGELPVVEKGDKLSVELDRLKKENKQLKDDVRKVNEKVKTLNKILLDLLQDKKREKESDGL